MTIKDLTICYSGRVDRVLASEIVDSGLIPDRVKQRLVLVFKFVFAASLLGRSAIKIESAKPPSCLVDRWQLESKIPSLSTGQGNLVKKMYCNYNYIEEKVYSLFIPYKQSHFDFIISTTGFERLFYGMTSEILEVYNCL